MTERAEKRALLVQCCRLPQFFFAAQALRRRRPDWRLEALLEGRDSPDKTAEEERTFALLEQFPVFDKVRFLGDGGGADAIRVSHVVFPLLNRGYRRIKRTAAKVKGKQWEIDYEGNLRPLRRGLLLLSSLTAPHGATADFAAYSKTFPEAPIGSRVLLAESCHPSLVQSTRRSWERWIPEGAEMFRVGAESDRRALSAVRRRKPDSAIVFFSGERGFFRLKALPFLLGVRKIVVINENGVHFTASPASLAGFLVRRIMRGVSQPTPKPAVLFVQTENPEYVEHAIRQIKGAGLYPESEVLLLCREADRQRLSRLSEVDRLFTYGKGPSLANLRLLTELRRLSPEMAGAVFSGRGVFRLAKAFFFLFADRPLLVFNARLDCYWLTPRSLPKLFRKEPLLFEEAKPKGASILLFQTEGPRYVLEAARTLKAANLYPESTITVFCRAEDAARLSSHPAVDRVIAFPSKGWVGQWKAWRQLRSVSRDIVAGIYTGRPVFRKQKLICFLSFGQPRLAFNAQLDCYWLSLRTLPKLFRKEPLKFADPTQPGTRILLIQTEAWQYVLEAARRLKGKNLYPNSSITALCREEDRSHFERAPEVARVLTFRARGKGRRRLGKRLREAAPEIVAGIFSGRSVFPRQKLLFFSYLRRRRLAFNARLDCYWLTPQSLPRIFRREPLLFDVEGDESSQALLIQTESVSETLKAIDVALAGRALPQKRIALFCREDLRSRFERHPGVSRVYAYRPGRFRENLKTLRSMARRDFDVTAAILSGRPVYRLQKFLFFVLPARNRLVFNEHLDCFYLGRSRLGRFLRLPSLYVPLPSRESASERLARWLLKGALFAPRFVYLLAWLTIAKLRRARRLSAR